MCEKAHIYGRNKYGEALQKTIYEIVAIGRAATSMLPVGADVAVLMTEVIAMVVKLGNEFGPSTFRSDLPWKVHVFTKYTNGCGRTTKPSC